jgi:hypothetical protein
MRRREVIAGFGAAAWPVVARAQQPERKRDSAVQVCRRRRTQMFTYAPKADPSAWMAAVIVATMLVGPARAEEGVPNFSPDNRTGWIAGDPNGPIPIGDDYLPQPPGVGPGPVVSDKDHPYIDNRVARLTGKQPNNRVADLSNPILQPWARESLRKLNARALSEPVFPTPKERCWPIGVPGWLLYPVTPVYFLQTPKQVVMIWQEDHMVRHIYLTDKHSPNVKPSWFGESIGHYENGDDVLINLNAPLQPLCLKNNPSKIKFHRVCRIRIPPSWPGL